MSYETSQKAFEGDYITGYAHGPSKVTRVYFNVRDGGWEYHLENGAILDNNDLNPAKVLVREEVQ